MHLQGKPFGSKSDESAGLESTVAQACHPPHTSTVSSGGYYLQQTFAWKRGRARVSEGPYYRWLDRLNHEAGNILRYMIIVSCLCNAWSAAWFSPGDLGEICAEAALPAWMTSSLTIFRYANVIRFRLQLTVLKSRLGYCWIIDLAENRQLN